MSRGHIQNQAQLVEKPAVPYSYPCRKVAPVAGPLSQRQEKALVFGSCGN